MSTITVFLLLIPMTLLCVQAAPAQSRSILDAEYYLKDVDRNVPKILEATANAAALSPTERHKWLNQIKFAGQKLDNVYSRLASVPAEDKHGQAIKKRADARSAELVAAAKTIQNADGAANQAAAAATKTIDADKALIDGLSQELAVTSLLQSDPARSAKTVRELPQMKKTCATVATNYQSVLEQPVGRALKERINGFIYRLKGYEQAMQQAAKTLPTSIQRNLETADRIAQLGITRKSAGPFTAGGIQHAFDRANNELDLLTAIGGEDPATRDLRKQIGATEQRIAAAQTQLEGEILKSNAAPNDLYQGADRDALFAQVQKLWQKKHGKKEVLAMRIPMPAWERHSSWRFAGDRFKKEDISEIQVAIVVKANATVAHVYYAYCEKDHLAGDKVKVTIRDTGDVPLYRRFLLKNMQ